MRLIIKIENDEELKKAQFLYCQIAFQVFGFNQIRGVTVGLNLPSIPS